MLKAAQIQYFSVYLKVNSLQCVCLVYQNAALATLVQS